MYALIAHDPINLVRAIEIDADSIDGAMERCRTVVREEFQLTPDLIVDLEAGEISRVYSTEDGFKTHPSAYSQLGGYTDQEFFENEMRDTQ